MKTKSYAFFLALATCSLSVFSQWSSTLNPYTSASGTSVVVDLQGNIYAGGYVFNSPTQKNNFYIVKYSPIGTVLSTLEFDYNSNDDQLIEMTIDKDNNLLVTGNSKATSEDILTVKYSPNGTMLKYYKFDGTNHNRDMASFIHADSLGNYYITGASQGAAYFGYVVIKTNAMLERISAQTYAPYYGGGVLGSSYNEVMDKIVLTGYHTDWEKYFLMGTVLFNNDLTRSWTKAYRPANLSSAVGFDVHLCDNGEVYTCGYETDTVTNVWEAMLLKFNAVGDTIWTRKLPNASTQTSLYKSLVVDATGNVYVTGMDGNKVITAKYSSAGALLWFQVQDGNSSYSGRDVHKSIKIDPLGNVLVLARDFPTSGGGIQLIKYSSEGKLVWTKHYNGSASGMDEPSTFAIDGLGNAYVVGISRNSTNYLEMCTIKFSAGNPNQLESLHAQDQRLIVWPTITTGKIYLQSIFNEPALLEVFSADGMLAYKESLYPNQSEVLLNGLKSGIYFVRVSNKSNAQMGKILFRQL